MTDNIQNQDQEQTQVEEPQHDADPQQDAPDETKVFDEDYVRKLRAEAAKYRTQAKENAEAAQKLQELEEAKKTEEQKQAERLAEAEEELGRYKHREQVSQWASDIVSEDEFKHIPASALRGDTEDELRDHAEQLKSVITPQQEPGPQPVPTIGKTPQTGNIPLSEQIKAAEASGNAQLVAALKAMQLQNS